MAEEHMAPEIQTEPEIAQSKPKRMGPPLGSQNSLTHGAYARKLRPAEEEERRLFEAELTEHVGGDPSAAQKVLIRRCGYLEIRLRCAERALKGGMGIPSEHVLSWVNAQRLLLVALGLERKARKAPVLADYLREKSEEGTISKCAN